jgi:hypothetical protein
VDIFSRKIVGWEVHEREGAELAVIEDFKQITTLGRCQN